MTEHPGENPSDSPQSSRQESLPKATDDCSELWIYAPEHYILEIAAGNDVIANPKRFDFPLFCSKAEAKRAIQALLDAGTHRGAWAVYRLEDTEGAPRSSDSPRRLIREARLISWERLAK